jgi:hypothetical protein
MSTFPLLKTGVVAQYPAGRSLTKSTWVGRFLDGSEQRFRLMKDPQHSWAIHLAELTEAEVVALREFVADAAGRFGTFSFTDPFDGATYASCSLDNDSTGFDWLFENNVRGTLSIRENRS